MRIKWIFFLLISLTAGISKAQETEDFDALERELILYAYEMHNDTSANNRLSAAKEAARLLAEILTKKGSYKHLFSELKGISILEPADKKFKIFSWEVFENKDTYRQFGIIQTANEKVFVLEDKSESIKMAEQARLKNDNWYGALYYHIQPFTTGINNESQYLLLGRDSYSFFERRKVIDILYFDFSGKPKFGNNILQVKDVNGQMRNVCRYFLQYSAAVSVILRYDQNMEMIVFDHLILGSPMGKDAPPSNVPDGSFNGLKLLKGKWSFVNMVFEYDPNNVLENAQNPEMIMSQGNKKRDGDKDIFGKDKNASKNKQVKVNQP
jgi:hypothetical protein